MIQIAWHVAKVPHNVEVLSLYLGLTWYQSPVMIMMSWHGFEDMTWIQGSDVTLRSHLMLRTWRDSEILMLLNVWYDPNMILRAWHRVLDPEVLTRCWGLDMTLSPDLILKGWSDAEFLAPYWLPDMLKSCHDSKRLMWLWVGHEDKLLSSYHYTETLEWHWGPDMTE